MAHRTAPEVTTVAKVSGTVRIPAGGAGSSPGQLVCQDDEGQLVVKGIPSDAREAAILKTVQICLELARAPLWQGAPVFVM
jgi:hypothetical protein